MIVQSGIETKTIVVEKGHFNDLSNENICAEMSLYRKKVFFDGHCGLNFFPAKMPIAVELNLKNRKLANVVEQTRNVSTWRDRSKKLPLMSLFHYLN